MNHRRDAVSATWEDAASFSYPARGPYFGRYIRIVGRQIHPALSITAEAEVVVDDMLHHIFHQLAKEIKAMGRAGTHLHASDPGALDPGASDPGASAAPSEDEAAPLATRRRRRGKKEARGEYVLRQAPSSRVLHEDTPRFKWSQDTVKGGEERAEGGEEKAASGASGASGGEGDDVVVAGVTTNETIGGHGMYHPDQVTARHVSLAVRLVCGVELTKHALSEGTKAIRNLQASWCAKSGEVGVAARSPSAPSTSRPTSNSNYEGPDDALLKLCMSEFEAPEMSKVRALIDAGIDLRFKSDTPTRPYTGMGVCKTALYAASARGHTDVVRVLLEADSSAEHIQALNDGYTALHIASENDHTDTVKALLEADPSAEHVRKVTTVCGNTALNLASSEGNRDTVEAILDVDSSVAHIRMSNKKGRTAFSLASTNVKEGTCHDNKNADEIKALFCRVDLNWGFDMSWDTLRERYFECRRNRSSSMSRIQFPVMVCGDMLTSFTGRPCSLQAVVFLAAVLEYHAAEILELAGNAANNRKNSSIATRHVTLGTRGDLELNNIFQGTIMRGGVFPHIHKMLLRARTGKLPFSSNGEDYVDNADGCVDEREGDLRDQREKQEEERERERERERNQRKRERERERESARARAHSFLISAPLLACFTGTATTSATLSQEDIRRTGRRRQKQCHRTLKWFPARATRRGCLWQCGEKWKYCDGSSWGQRTHPKKSQRRCRRMKRSK